MSTVTISAAAASRADFSRRITALALAVDLLSSDLEDDAFDAYGPDAPSPYAVAIATLDRAQETLDSAALALNTPITADYFYVLNALLNGEEGYYALTTSGSKLTDGHYYLLAGATDGVGPYPSVTAARAAVANL